MNWDEYKTWSKKGIDWGSDYRKKLRDFPVRAQVNPGDIFKRIPNVPPENPEKMATIFDDFKEIILPGITHWQHPRFFSYFPSNASPSSVFAELLTNTMSPMCMLWQTSPAATELEEKIIDWLKIALGLAPDFQGVIQDSATSATLSAVLTMRERSLNWEGNKKGLFNQKRLRIYVSTEAHISVDRAIWFSGIGEENLIKIPAEGKLRSMNTNLLIEKLNEDKKAGFIPSGVIGVVGGTSSGSCDNISELSKICMEESMYLHVDAAWAGSAMICEEHRDLWKGVDEADSIVFNPYKWLGSQFDCSVQFLKDNELQKKTHTNVPDYLKTSGINNVTNLSELTIPLGRRFRALKIWFLLRSEGLEKLREMIRNHIKWSITLRQKLGELSGIEIVTEPILSLFTFRYTGNGNEDLNALNERILREINDEGQIYLTPTTIEKKYAIRFVTGTFESTEQDVELAYKIIKDKIVS